jgi:hypothetical protein
LFVISERFLIVAVAPVIEIPFPLFLTAVPSSVTVDPLY